MKNTLKIIAMVFTASFLLTCCCKNDRYIDTYFYVNETASENRFKLFIDDTYKGELPFINTETPCNPDSIKHLALFIPIKDRNYKVEARDGQGRVMTSGVIKIKTQGISATGSAGNTGITRTPELVIVNLSYNPENTSH